VNQTEFALGVGRDIITYYEKYYNLGYPLPKQGLLKFALNMTYLSFLMFLKGLLKLTTRCTQQFSLLDA